MATSETLPVRRRAWPAWLALGLVLLAGWILRYQAEFASALIPGINGAYPAVQARAILRTGLPGIPDFPLLFYLQAGLGWLFSLFLGEQGILTATRWTDIVLPVLIAIPVFLFAREFTRSLSSPWRAAAATLTAGLTAVASDGLLRMLGDFQKQAAGLPLSLTFLYFFYRALSTHRRRDAWLAALFFGLACLTHIGVAALTLVLAGFLILHGLFHAPSRRRAAWIALGLLAVLAVVMAVVYLLDPTRVERLLGMAVTPSELFANSMLLRWLGRGEVGLSLRPFEGLVLGNLLGLIGVVTALLVRKSAPAAERGLLWATSLTALFLASPAIGSEWSQRLAMMAFVPGLIPLIYLATRLRLGWVAAALVAALVVAGTLPGVGQVKNSTITYEAYQELVSLKDALPEGKTLVIARHGLEWWVAWTMDTYVANRVSEAADAWDQYDAVYYIAEINAAAFGGASPADGAPAGIFNPGAARQPVNPPSVQRPALNPPGVTGPIGPGGGTWPQGGGTPQTPQSGQPRLQATNQIPSELLETVQQGTYFRLSRVTQRPQTSAIGPEAGPMGPFQPLRPAPGLAQPPTIVPRSDWGARAMDLNARVEHGVFDPQTNPNGVLTYPGDLREWLTTVVVHHSALPLTQGPREIQALHMDQRGYADIGYHFIIAPDGTIYEGRPIGIRGAHVAGYNTGTVGVVLLGNFNETLPPEAQMRSLTRLLSYLRVEYGVTHLAGHQDFPDQGPQGTECPGAKLEERLPALAQATGLIYGIGGYIQPPWQTGG